ncbi:MAG: hypothetical protein RLZZ480_470 [Candidatus Parcubacteria bacterium]|jgi:hypothetical protein
MNKVSEALKILKPLANTTRPRGNTRNKGKIRKDLISFNLLSEAYLALSELENALKFDNKISADLLVRYIFEIEIDFSYLFKVNKGKQNLCDAYFYFGNKHQQLVIKNGNPEPDHKKWLAALGKSKVNQNHWSGLQRKELIRIAQEKDVTNVSVLYKIFSGFTHPNIFTLERTLHDISTIYPGYSEINTEFPGYLVNSMFLFAIENNLYGVNKNNLSNSLNLLRKYSETLPPSFEKK